jgi:hypothetical protein
MNSRGAAARAARSEAAMVLVSSAALAVVITWPLTLQLGTAVPSDLGDPVLNTWILWWNSVRVPLTEAWWNAPVFYPARGAFAFSEHLLGLTVLSSPVNWITGNPQLAYNVTFLLTFALSAAAAYWLGRALTGRRDAAALCGLAFACAPYRIAHLPHLQVLASFWMPLALLGLHRTLTDGRLRWALLFAAAWLLQALSNGYYLLFFPLLIGLWWARFLRPRDGRRAIALLAGFVIPALLVLPILLKYREIHAQYGLVRNAAVIRGLSADLMSWLDASPLLALWGHLRVFHRSEGELFTGVTILIVIVFGIVAAWRRRREDRPADRHHPAALLHFYALAAVAMFLLALGPSPTFFGEPIGIPGPYAALLRLPGFEGLRVPARLSMPMVLCLSVAAALAFAMLSAAWPQRRRRLAAGAIAALIVAEGWATVPLWQAHRRWDIRADEIQGALLVLPILNAYTETAHMYRATGHGRPIVNGYSGYSPPWHPALVDGLNRQDPMVLDQLAAAGVTQIAVVDRNDPDGAWRQYVSQRASPARHSGDGFLLFMLDRAQPVPAPGGEPLPVASITVSAGSGSAESMTDGDPRTMWRTNDAQMGGETLTVELASTYPLAAIELSPGPRTLDYPRELIVDVSEDGSAWRTVWSGRTAALALAAAFRDSRAMPFRVPLGDARGRFVRVHQRAGGEAFRWSVAELKVFGRRP